MAPGSTLDKIATALVLFAGLAAVTFGLWQAWGPLAWVFGGSVAVVAALGSNAEAPKK
jgi:hypothetical protein